MSNPVPDEPIQETDTKTTYKVSPHVFDLVQKSARDYRKRMRRERFVERNPLAWFLNQLPAQDMYRASLENRRSTRQEMRYHRLRQRTSWSFWSHMKSSTGLKFAAIAGLVSALFQAVPELRGHTKDAVPFNWLLVAGLFYIVAVVWFEVCCPTLLKQSLSPKPRYLGLGGRRWLQALVEDELCRWWEVRKWWPDPRLLDMDSSHDKTALAIMSGYGVPAFAGFNVYACAHIEQALYEFSQVTGAKIWRRERTSKKMEKFKPSRSLEGNRPVMRRLVLRHLEIYDIGPEDQAKAGDIVFEWFKSPINIAHNLPSHRKVNMMSEAEGLDHLFKDDRSALAITEIIAFWQDNMRPLRRLVLMMLFSGSALSFSWFVFLQLRIVLSGITF
ncbi:hypothetical protein [Pseudomonas sp. 18173]|uniref:hypothetical protein n=1 Tax=Pseudomonas sp. 18173 TaxID=3390055 RepID=UPI003D25528F